MKQLLKIVFPAEPTILVSKRHFVYIHKEQTLGSKDSSQSRGILIYQQEYKSAITQPTLLKYRAATP